MLINRIPNATRNLGKPADWDSGAGSCVSLPIQDVKLSGGIPAMMSSWSPTPDELERLNAGASVTLTVVGVSHPPVMLNVGMVPKERGHD